MRILRIVSEAFKNKIDNNNFGEYNNNNGNFISVLECTIINLAMYLGNLQLAVWDLIIPPQNNLKNQKKKIHKKFTKKSKLR